VFYDAFKQASSDGKAVNLSEFSKVFATMGITDPLVVESTFHGKYCVIYSVSLLIDPSIAWDLNHDGTIGSVEDLLCVSYSLIRFPRIHECAWCAYERVARRKDEM